MTHPTIDGTEENAPRGVSFAVSAGDVSFHYSDVLHASMPPTSADGPHRISVLLGFSPEGAGHHRGERHYNDVLLSRDDGLVPHLVDHLDARRDKLVGPAQLIDYRVVEEGAVQADQRAGPIGVGPRSLPRSAG